MPMAVTTTSSMSRTSAANNNVEDVALNLFFNSFRPYV